LKGISGLLHLLTKGKETSQKATILLLDMVFTKASTSGAERDGKSFTFLFPPTFRLSPPLQPLSLKRGVAHLISHGSVREKYLLSLNRESEKSEKKLRNYTCEIFLMVHPGKEWATPRFEIKICI